MAQDVGSRLRKLPARTRLRGATLSSYCGPKEIIVGRVIIVFGMVMITLKSGCAWICQVGSDRRKNNVQPVRFIHVGLGCNCPVVEPSFQLFLQVVATQRRQLTSRIEVNRNRIRYQTSPDPVLSKTIKVLTHEIL